MAVPICTRSKMRKYKMNNTGARILLIGIIVALLAGCSAPSGSPTPLASDTPVASATLPEPGVRTTPVPDPEAAARQFLDGWQQDDYQEMYALLSELTQADITPEEFEQRYRRVSSEAAVQDISYEILSSLTNPRNAQVAYRVILDSVLVGEISRDMVMNLALETDGWRIQWEPGLILPELAGGNYLWMDRYIPSRANIYDREGEALVAQADAVSIGLDSSTIDPDNQEDLLSLIYRVFGNNPNYHPNVLEPQLENYRNFGWYLPIGEVSVDAFAPYEGALTAYDGVILQPYRARFYFDHGAAPHVAGYVSAIQQDELEVFLRQGYAQNERVGRAGMERWGEPYLSGTRGGALYVLGPDDKVVTRLAEKDSQVAQSIYTTLEQDLQIGAQRALAGLNGAIVVMERDTGRVLALASSPGFDPNAFEFTNPNSSALLQEIYSNPNAPFLNRATQGQYPLGSVFKIITMAAALESGEYTANTTYECGYFFEELDGVRLQDWTYEHFLRGDETPPSGLLTLPEGLMRSCNPYFYHIGLDLYASGMGGDVSQMARDFGLGQKTGIYGLPDDEESTGNIPDPGEAYEAVINAIGQGETLVTPIQVANFIAAIGNGGTFYRPQLVERIEPPGEEPTFVFEPEVTGELPLSPENLLIIQEAMQSVVTNPRGTARSVLGPWSTSNRIPIAGKTGTAEDPPRDPHAWFAGYTYAGRENRPDIVVVVVAENAGEGSEVAAPIFKAMLEIYFNGQRSTRFPWESSLGVLATPEPPEEDGEQPTEEETQQP
jgi:penicillin-binding protein 2